MSKQLIYIYILLLLLSSFFAKAQGGWKRQYALPNTVAGLAWNVVECPNGNFIVIGITYDNQYCNNLTLLCTDSQGNELWRKDYGNCGFKFLNFGISGGTITDTNVFYIAACVRDTAHLNMDMSVLIKFNYQGDTLWQRKYETGQSNVHLYIENLSKSIDGGILLVGE